MSIRTISKILAAVLGIGTIAAGVYCMVNPELTTLKLIYIVGIVMIVDAIIKLINWFALRKEYDSDGVLLFSAIISLVLGIFLVADGFVQWMVDAIIIYAAAAWVLVSGALRIVRAFKLKDLSGKASQDIGKNWWVLLIFGLALVGLSIFMLFNPMVTSIAIGIVIAIALIFIGCNILTFAAIV